MKKILAAMLLVAFTGCASEQGRRQAYITTHPNISASTKDSILQGLLEIGMSYEQVEAVRGKPCAIHVTTTEHGSLEQWVYGEINVNSAFLTVYVPPVCGRPPFLYFENQKLKGWQF